MVKGRGGKGKKQYTTGVEDVVASTSASTGDEEKILVRRRGRPLKLLKDDHMDEDEEEEFDNMEKQQHSTSVKNSVSKTLLAASATAKNKRKRKRPNITAKKCLDLVKEDNDIEDKPKTVVGLKTNVSRRKNKPHRAAEVGVEC